MTSPALYRAFVTGELSAQSALGRYLVAVAVSAVMLALLRFFTAGYGHRRQPSLVPLRRRTDPPADDQEPAGTV